MISLIKLAQKLYNCFRSLSIRYKMIFFFFSIIIFVSSVLSIYSYIVSSQTIQDEMTAISLKDTKQISSSIEFLQKDVNDLSTFICLNPLIQSFLKSDKAPNSEQNFIRTSLEPLNTLLASKEYISFIIIYGKNGLTYYLSNDGSNNVASFEKVQASQIYNNITSLKGSPLWINLDIKNQIFILDNKKPKIAMTRSILDTSSLENSGMLLICINQDTLENIYSSNLKNNPNTSIILDNKNNIISMKSEDSNLVDKKDVASVLPHITSDNGHSFVSIRGERFLATFSLIKESQWKYVSLIPLSELLKHLRSFLITTLTVVMACLLISFIMSMLISSALTSPIKELLQSMKRVKKGNFKEKVDFKYADEIGLLGAEYNDMIDNIQTLINSVYKLQLKKKEAELRALQAQINPHFLYNTLNTIFWKAEKANQKDIADMVYALSKLFRITLNKGNEFIELSTEKEFIEHYLLLQSSRYKDKLTYKIDIDESILSHTIPKLLLQPFVENSIIHGTEGENYKSHISIEGILKDNKLIFTITDNGIGMSKEVISHLLRTPTDTTLPYDSNQGYAISNVKERLALYYNEDYKLDIVSELGKGTKVTIVLPPYPNKLN